MNKWPHEVKATTTEEIKFYILDPEWQRVRLSLKGLSTEQKLIKLDAWRHQKLVQGVNGILIRGREVQIDNYINALKRGGQLNADLEVVK